MAVLKTLQLLKTLLMALVYSKLSELGKIGITEKYVPTSEVSGPHLPLCITGTLQAKTKTLFKPRIPQKPGKTVYKGVMIREVKGFYYLYDFDTSIFIASMHALSHDPREWIDKNEARIKQRLEELICHN